MMILSLVRDGHGFEGDEAFLLEYEPSRKWFCSLLGKDSTVTTSRHCWGVVVKSDF